MVLTFHAVPNRTAWSRPTTVVTSQDSESQCFAHAATSLTTSRRWVLLLSRRDMCVLDGVNTCVCGAGLRTVSGEGEDRSCCASLVLSLLLLEEQIKALIAARAPGGEGGG
eukprot:655860-Rhodomonas_salina.2